MKKVTVTMTRTYTREVSHTIQLPEDWDVESTEDFLLDNKDLYEPYLETAIIFVPDDEFIEEFRYDVTEEVLVVNHVWGGHL